MAAIIRFKALWGTSDEESHCYLLEVDDYTFLLDCGWDYEFKQEKLENLTKVVKKVDAVLLTYPDVMHLGALPYAVGKLGLNCPVYATIPVYKMGQMFMYDAYLSRVNHEEFDAFNLDDVDSAFDRMIQLKYSQPFYLEGKGKGIELLPLNAGHMIGGTIWKIKKETEEIIYAVDYNHRKERHLNGAALGTLMRPTVLITDATTFTSAKKEKDSAFLENILKTTRANGSVLIPVDSAGRVLELLAVMDQHWDNHKLNNIPLAFMSNQAYNTIEFAKSQLEWMSDAVMNAFDHGRANPFVFKCVRLCYNIEQFNQLPFPKVVLATMPDLESGFARQILSQFCQSSDNLILFPEKPAHGSVAHTLVTSQTPFTLSLEIKNRVPLQGQELEEFLAKKKAEEEAKKKTSETAETEARVESDSEDSEEEVTKVAFQNGMDYTPLRFTQEGFRHPMFPFVEKYSNYDDYGEIVNEKDFQLDDMVIEEPASKKAFPSDRYNPEELMDDEEPEEPEEEVPSKCVSSALKLNVKCKIVVLDMSGRADARSIKTLLQQVAPRKMIIVHGSEEAKTEMVSFCEKTLKTAVIVPKPNEMTDVALDTNMFKVKLKDTLIGDLQFQKVGDYQLTWVNGLALPSSESDQDHALPELHEVPTQQVPGHRAVFVGDVKLADFKQVLLQSGYKSEFVGGSLLTADGTISLRKEEVNGSSRIKIEGCLSDDYFKIRELLYSQYTIL